MRKTFIALLFGILLCSIAYPQQSGTANEAPTVSREDSEITSDARNKISQDERLRGLTIDLVTLNGVVTLTGTVSSQAQADRAVELAQGAAGAVSVVNKLEINSAIGEDVDTPTLQEKGEIVEKGQKEIDEAADLTGDARIVNEIKVGLAGNDMVKSRNIRVLSSDGVVILRGTVRTTEEEEQAITISNSVPGVREVKSELKIDSSAD